MSVNEKYKERFDNDEVYQKLHLEWKNKTRNYLLLNFKKNKPCSTSEKDLELEKQMLVAEYDLKKYIASQLSQEEFRELEETNNKINCLENIRNEIKKIEVEQNEFI